MKKLHHLLRRPPTAQHWRVGLALALGTIALWADAAGVAASPGPGLARSAPGDAAAGPVPEAATAASSASAASAGDDAANHWLQAIVQEIGDAPCDANAQCHSIGIGAKACGGPERYLAWSSAVTSPGRLAALVARQRAARQEDNVRTGRLSTCMMTPDPGAACRPRAADGRRVCQLGQLGQLGKAGPN